MLRNFSYLSSKKSSNSSVKKEIWKQIEKLREDVIDKALEDRPCHIVLHKISNLIKETQKVICSDFEEGYKLFENDIRYYIKHREKALKKLIKNSSSLLKGKRKILVFGYSKTVIEALRQLYSEIDSEDEMDMIIFVAEGNNKRRFNFRGELSYSDGGSYAEAISEVFENKNCEIHVVPDAVLSLLMLDEIYVKAKNGNSEKVKNENQIDTILLGVNGLDINQKLFGHTAGHLNIVDLAADHKIPLYIFADSWKVGNLIPDQSLRRGNWLYPPEWFRRFQERKIFIWNPREDIVELVKDGDTSGRLLITDKGVFSTHKLPENLESTFSMLKKR